MCFQKYDTLIHKPTLGVGATASPIHALLTVVFASSIKSQHPSVIMTETSRNQDHTHILGCWLQLSHRATEQTKQAYCRDTARYYEHSSGQACGWLPHRNNSKHSLTAPGSTIKALLCLWPFTNNHAPQRCMWGKACTPRPSIHTSHTQEGIIPRPFTKHVHSCAWRAHIGGSYNTPYQWKICLYHHHMLQYVGVHRQKTGCSPFKALKWCVQPQTQPARMHQPRPALWLSHLLS